MTSGSVGKKSCVENDRTFGRLCGPRNIVCVPSLHVFPTLISSQDKCHLIGGVSHIDLPIILSVFTETDLTFVKLPVVAFVSNIPQV